jgi:phosphate acyltransferase
MKVTIAVDLMGGDKAPKSTIEGIKEALKKNANLSFICFGSGEVINKAKHTLGEKRCEFVESSDDILSHDKVNIAIRKKESSMSLCLKATQEGKASASVSSGKTGALMAISKLYFRTIEGITRPAICTVIPTVESTSVLLDMGANAECTPQNLLEFAIMGCAFIKGAFGVSNPTVGIVNIGEEETKGTPLVQEAYQLFKNSIIAKNFSGFIEGDELHNGKVNVIVTDGFTGNVVLKTMEGSGKTMKYYLQHYMLESILGKLALLIGFPCFKKIKSKIDPNKYNGAMFLGLNGIAVKSHGSSNAEGFANAIEVAYNLAISNVNTTLKEEIKQIHNDE